LIDKKWWRNIDLYGGKITDVVNTQLKKQRMRSEGGYSQTGPWFKSRADEAVCRSNKNQEQAISDKLKGYGYNAAQTIDSALNDVGMPFSITAAIDGIQAMGTSLQSTLSFSGLAMPVMGAISGWDGLAENKITLGEEDYNFHDPCDRHKFFDEQIEKEQESIQAIASDYDSLAEQNDFPIPADPPITSRPQLNNYKTSFDIGKNALVQNINMGLGAVAMEIPLPKTSFIGVKNQDTSSYNIQQVAGEMITQNEMEYFVTFQWENSEFVESIKWRFFIPSRTGLYTDMIRENHQATTSANFNFLMSHLIYELIPRPSDVSRYRVDMWWVHMSYKPGERQYIDRPLYKRLLTQFATRLNGGVTSDYLMNNDTGVFNSKYFQEHDCWKNYHSTWPSSAIEQPKKFSIFYDVVLQMQLLDNVEPEIIDRMGLNINFPHGSKIDKTNFFWPVQMAKMVKHIIEDCADMK
jgi:hypothetical protein